MTLQYIESTFSGTGTDGQTISLANNFSVSVIVESGTLKLERSFDNGLSWREVDSYTSSTEDWGYDPEGALYRWRCSAFTTGPISGRLGQ